MTDPTPGGNRTVFRPSPLQGLKAAPPPAARAFPLVPAGGLAAQAAPLLALVAGLRSGRLRLGLPDLHRQASARIGAFAATAAATRPAEAALRATYALCATVDEAALHLPGPDSDTAHWARHTLTARFAPAAEGDAFWRYVDDALAAGADARELVELYHACIAAGFEGRFRLADDGRAQVDAAITRLHAVLSPADRAPTRLGPAPCANGPLPPPRHGISTAVVAAVTAVLLVLAFGALHLSLQAGTAAPAAALARSVPTAPLRLIRADPVGATR